MGLSDYLRLKLGFRFYSPKQIKAMQLRTIRKKLCLGSSQSALLCPIGFKRRHQDLG